MSGGGVSDWHWSQAHYRDLARRLEAEGFEVVGVRNGRHLGLSLVKDGLPSRTTIASSPSDRKVAVDRAMREARRNHGPPARWSGGR